MFDNGYPYTDFHEMNLDWLIRELKSQGEKIESWIQFSQIKFADPIDWDINTTYAAYTIVLAPDFNSYISKRDVSGHAYIDYTNTDFWYKIGNYNAQVEGVKADLRGIGVTPEMYGAKGDGLTDDTHAIQLALNSATNVIFSNKTYMIDATKSIKPNSGNKLIMSAATVLKALPNSADYYKVIYLSKVNNVEIIGGNVYGDRANHLGTTGESGHCINVRDCTDIKIDGVTCKYAWGDGVFIGGDEVIPNNIEIVNCEISNNRRQGISVIKGDNIKIDNCYIHDISGTAPSDCIDLEPNYEYEYIRNCIISNCRFEGLVELHFNASKVENSVKIMDCYSGGYAVEFSSNSKDSVVKLSNIHADTRWGTFNFQNASNSCYVYCDNCTNYCNREPVTPWDSGIYFAGDNYNIFVNNLILEGKKFYKYINHSTTTPGTLHNCVINIKLVNTETEYNIVVYNDPTVNVSITNCVPVVTSNTLDIYLVGGGKYIYQNTNAPKYFKLSKPRCNCTLEISNISNYNVSIRKSNDNTGLLLNSNGESVTEINLGSNECVRLICDSITGCIKAM